MAVSVLSQSCIDDSSAYGGNPLPELSVKVPGDAEMPVYSFNYGEDCVLTPDVHYDGDGELTYEWSVGTYANGVKGELTKVSNDKTLVYFFPEGGAYYAHLTVTDGEVGLAQDYEIDINRTFEQGYLLITNTPEGKGNLAFIKDLTREEIEAGLTTTIMENCLQRVNDNVGDSKLISAKVITWYAFVPGVGPVETNRLAVITENEGLYIDPNTFVVAADIKYNDVIPGFKADQMIINNTSSVVLDHNMKRYLTLNSDNMFGYEDSEWKGSFFDAVISNTYTYGSNQTTENYFYNRSPLAVIGWLPYKTDKWAWTNELNPNGTPVFPDENGNPLFTNEELVVIFKGEVGNSTSTGYCFVISRNKTTGKLYSTAISGFGGYSKKLTIVGRKEIVTTASSALPQTESQVIGSDLYHRTFFFNDNKLYVMLLNSFTYNLPTVSQAAITFPANEEITYMMIRANRTSGSEDLVIATADKSSGRANVYIYDVKDVRTDNPNPSPATVYRNCSDRITTMMYKPRIAN